MRQEPDRLQGGENGPEEKAKSSIGKGEGTREPRKGGKQDEPVRRRAGKEERELGRVGVPIHKRGKGV